MQKDGSTRAILLHIIAASAIGVAAAAGARHYWQLRQSHQSRSIKAEPEIVTPKRFDRTESVHGDTLEGFSHYVARQIGFSDPSECPQLCKLAYDYLKKSEGCEDNIYGFIANEADADALYMKLIEEFDRCILGYFAFNWNLAKTMITQVLRFQSADQPKRKLKSMVLAATRKQRFDRVTKDLKVTRVFSTLVEEIKAIGTTSDEEDRDRENVMKPVKLSERSPVLLFMGGGMGVGKSTVLKDILKEPFWSGAAEKAVVVEADAFKETDVIYRAISSKGHHDDMLQTAELVHQSSTDAASSLLVTALNEGRDVIMDGTLSWEPFVEQTITMARNVHRCRYSMGVGYKVAEDGTITENYWQQKEQYDEVSNKRKPYRIEMVGVVCDAYLAVIRGIRRAIMIGRAVRVKSQLTSHKRFANAFPKYCNLVDNARLYCTNSMGTPPKLIGWKDGTHNLLVDQEEIECLKKVSMLNEDADSIHELYQQQPEPSTKAISNWHGIVKSLSRATTQQELKIVITKIEKQDLLSSSDNS